MTVQQTIKALRIILAMALAGLVLFLAEIFFVAADSEGEPEYVLLFALAALVVGEVIAYVALRRIWAGQLHRRFTGREVEEDEPLILRCFFTVSFAAAALTEGASFFGAVTYWIGNSPPALVVPFLGALLLLAQWPTLDRYRAFFERIAGPQAT